MSDASEISFRLRQNKVSTMHPTERRGLEFEAAVALDEQAARIEELERENALLIASIKKREPWFGAWMPDSVYERLKESR